jgi:adenosylmethionine-8-amino-7-oxononanoate aminotransferase
LQEGDTFMHTFVSAEASEGLGRNAQLLVMLSGLTINVRMIDGHIGDHVLLAPPFIVTEPDVDEIVDRLATSNKQATDGLSSR